MDPELASQLAGDIMLMTSAAVPSSNPSQGSISSAGAGITGGYTGDSFSLRAIITFFLGLSMYNALELVILTLTTFRHYSGLYFWSLIVAGLGVLPYSLGFLIKFFRLLDPYNSSEYVAIVLLTIGWWTMVTGQAVVLWSRLHLVLANPRILRWTLYMIIINVVILHIPTTVLTFGSNSSSLAPATLDRFVNGYNIMEKIQMCGFCVQELIISSLYITETLKLLRLGRSLQPQKQFEGPGHNPRQTMYQLLAINIIIVIMDAGLLGVEFANLYIVETTLKGTVYSIKLKLEFAVLSKLVNLVRGASGASDPSGSGVRKSKNLTLEKSHSLGGTELPGFVDPSRVSGDLRHAEAGFLTCENSRRRSRRDTDAWFGVEMDMFNIGPLNEGERDIT